MGIFGRSKDREISRLRAENRAQKERIEDLVRRSDSKDEFFLEMISDGLRHGSSLAAKHMSDRKKYLNGEY